MCIRKKLFLLSLIFCFLAAEISVQAQNKKDFRAINTPLRDWWNVLYYDLTIEPDFNTQSIKGVNVITYERVKDKQFIMQIDLQQPMRIDSVIASGVSVTFSRMGNIYKIDLFDAFLYNKNQKGAVFIYFSGKPKIAQKAPWDGGWIFSRDNNKNPWMTVACEELGASSWFPCKDFLDDEPEQGMKMTIITTKDLVGVGNGKLLSKKKYEISEDQIVKTTVKEKNGKTITKNKVITQKFDTGKTAYIWQITQPINAYNIVPYIGDYKEFTDSYRGEKGILPLDYWVLSYNVDKAKKQFEQVKPMLKALEYWFGAYPFYEDSYKLVESSHLGMEHQSNIAYGNKYQNGYLGTDRSETGEGLKWDFIIVHESAHEWFGNSITCNNMADMWIHEAFATYAETLFMESTFKKENAEKYIIGQRKNIKNDVSIANGSGDMYDKGANMLHTLRQWIDNDNKFRQMLRDMNKNFYHKTVSEKEIEDFMASASGLNLTKFFDQYLRQTKVPTFEYFIVDKETIRYRWKNTIPGFDMPIKTSLGKLVPTNKPQKITAKKKIIAAFSVNPNYYIEVKKVKKMSSR
ncbi:MAG: M1 family metallopeptidase [Flavobacteriaceae bacterium]|jgi:aminopeptidase N|nr:M1 family metallopeptidase [Flavobacteriaceae bacterium]